MKIFNFFFLFLLFAILFLYAILVDGNFNFILPITLALQIRMENLRNNMFIKFAVFNVISFTVLNKHLH